MNNAPAFKFHKMLPLHQGVINNLSYAPEIGQIATCGGDGQIKILDAEKLIVLKTLRTHQYWVDDIKFSEDTLNLFSIGRDDEIRIWRTPDYQCLFNLSATGFGKAPLSENATLVATSQNKKFIQIKNTIDGKQVSQILVNTRNVSCHCFSAKDKFFATAHNDGTIKIYSPYSGDLLCTLVSDFSQVTSIVFSPGLEMIAAGSNDGHINIWLTGDQRKIIMHQVSYYKITALQFTANNKYLHIGDLRGDIFTIDISQNTRIFTDSKHAGGITFIKVCHPLNQFAVGSLDGNVSFYQLSHSPEPIEKPQSEEFDSNVPGLDDLIRKADPMPISSNKTFKVVNKASSVKTQKIQLPTPQEISTNKISTSISDEKVVLQPKAHFKEWKIGDAIDEMLNIFGYAKGGMGAVYFVRHRNWQVKLAMKSPLPENTNDDFIMQRFIREATTWISLGVHPNIASCFFVKKIEGIPRIFIEYIENGSLYDWIYKGKLTNLELILKFAIQFCTGMEYAHRRGVIHRDIKPSNCLISADNNLKITDFGLVKMAQHPEEPVNRNMESLRKKIRRDITTDNSAMGTPEYMSPEQWEASNEVGPESDIYSFGIMLFEMICSRKPFLKSENDGIFKMLQLHSLSEPPNPTHFIKNFPPALKKIIIRCLQKNITARYQNFNDILFDLKKVYEQITKKEYPEGKSNATHINPETKNNYSISLLELGFTNEADEMLSRAKTSYKDNFPVNFNYHLRQWKSHQWSDLKLLEFLQDRIEKDTENEQAIQSLCILLIYREEYNLCIEKIHQFKGYKNSSFLLNLLSISLLMSDQNDEGMKHFNLASQVSPPGPEILLTYASIFFFKNNKPTAKELYDNVMAKYPQTYKLTDNTHYHSEYQIMKALLISHFPGLPFIANQQLPHDHGQSINSILITKNATHLLIFNQRNELKIWDFKEHKYLINILTLPENAIVKTMAQKNTVAVLNNSELFSLNWLDQSRTQLISNLSEVANFGFTSKDTFVFVIFQNNSLLIKNLKNGESKSITFESKINCISSSYQENYLALGFVGGKIKVLSLPDLEIFMETNHATSITSVAFLEEGTLLTGHEDNLILVWDLLMGSHSEILVAPYYGCKQIIPNLKENPQNASKFIAIFNNNQYVFWNRQEKRNLISFKKITKHLAICPYHQQFVSVNENFKIESGTISYPDLPLLQYIYCKPSLTQDSILPENDFEVLINECKENIQDNLYPDAYIAVKEALSIKGFEKSPKALELLYAISNKGELKNIADIWFDYFILEKMNSGSSLINIDKTNLIAIPSKNKIVLWNILTKESETINVNLPDTYIKLKWLGKNYGYSFIILNNEKELNEYNSKTGESVKLNITTRGNCVDFCILYNYFCVLDSTGQFLVHDLHSKNLLFKEELGKSAKQITEYPPGKNVLISHENFLQIFSLDLRTNQRNFKGPKAPIKKISFSPMGRFIAQTNIDGSTCIWNAFTSQIISNLPFDETISALQFSPNSSYLAIADTKGTLSLIDMNTDSIAFRFKNVINPIKSIIFTHNSQYLIAASHKESKIAVFEINWDMQFSQASNTNLH